MNSLKDTINVALLGMGTVGSGVYEVIEKLQKGQFVNKVGADVRVRRVLVRTPAKYADRVQPHTILTTDWQDVVNDPDIDIVVEVIGGMEPAKTYILQALRAGKSVVSANKDLIAVYGQEIRACAAQAGVDFMYEAAVLGAVPIIRPLKVCLAANNISEIVGIMNGTTNYILTQMGDKGWDFGTALGEAQRLGYAEADPTSDVEGLDAGRKVAIMANLAFHTPVVFDDVHVEGITRISAIDMRYAESIGCCIKLLGIATKDERGVMCRVHPAILDKNHPLASVGGSFNAAFVRGDAVDEAMFYGRGAGRLPTASAVVGDVMDVCRNIRANCCGRVTDATYEHLPIRPLAESESRFYIRLHIPDQAGVLAAVADCFGRNDVSIAQVMQAGKHGPHGVELVIITHSVKEAKFNAAVREMSDVRPDYRVENVIRVYGDLPNEQD